MRHTYFVVIIFMLLPMIGCQATKPTVKKAASAFEPIFTKSSATQILASDIAFNTDTGEISYTLPQSAMVRIRIGLPEGGPLLGHIVDWEYRDKGVHKELWDGRIKGYEVDLRGRKDLMMTLMAEPLENKTLKQSPNFQLSYPDSKGKNQQGLPIVERKTAIRITIADEDLEWLNNNRYEIVFYIDNLFLMEEEEGINPFTYYLDTENFNEGVHTITVNIVAYDGNAGTRSSLIMVKNRE